MTAKFFPLIRKVVTFTLVIGVSLVLFGGCRNRNRETSGEDVGFQSLLLFIPGMIEGSPVYEMLADGVKRAASEQEGVTLHILEGGFSQGEWEEQIASAAATGKYDLIVTSNPSMPDLCAPLTDKFPGIRFLIFDAYLEGNSAIATFQFNQWEQAYLTGYASGLVTSSRLPGANAEQKTGFIAAQEYPVMNDILRPLFERGLHAVLPDATVEFRVIGNWYDAARAADLAAELFAAGCDVILTIAGGANQGVLSEAEKQGHYVMWFDSNGYDLAPGTVAGSSVMRMDTAAYAKTIATLKGETTFGTAEIGGAAEDYVAFITDDPVYKDAFPAELRNPMDALMEQLRSGDLTLP